MTVLKPVEAVPEVSCAEVSALTSSVGRGLKVEVAGGYEGAPITSWTSIGAGVLTRTLPGAPARADVLCWVFPRWRFGSTRDFFFILAVAVDRFRFQTGVRNRRRIVALNRCHAGLSR